MDAENITLLVAIILIVALIAYVVWRNQKVRTSVGVGPVKMNLDTERTTERDLFPPLQVWCRRR